MVNGRCAGEDGADGPDVGLTSVDMQYVVKTDADETATELEGTRIVNVQDLITSRIDAGGASISVKEVIAFVVLKFDPSTDATWTVPELSLIHI